MDYAYEKTIHEKAHAAGLAAAEAAIPVPMGVAQHENPLDDSSPIVKGWVVSEGACGFAWVIVRPGNCRYAQFLKKELGCKKDYYGGINYWVRGYGQFITRKEAYAKAYAEVLQDNGISAHSGSRLD